MNETVNDTKLDNTTGLNIQGSDNKINISSIIEDNNGGLSSMRILMLLWGGGVFLIWAFGAIMAILHDTSLPTIQPEIVTLTLGMTGIKCVQRGFEKS